jgi:hypothetical protein
MKEAAHARAVGVADGFLRLKLLERLASEIE